MVAVWSHENACRSSSEMSLILSRHWGSKSQERDTSPADNKLTPSTYATRYDDDCYKTPGKINLMRMVKRARRSAPRADGIPHAAYNAELACEHLHEMMRY